MVFLRASSDNAFWHARHVSVAVAAGLILTVRQYDTTVTADPGLELASPQGYVPRTQDSGFSIDGLQQGGSRAERSGSGDSLASLPKLQPVHRLTRPDLKHLHKIGEGAFGEVSLASAPLYGNVAVKWLKVSRSWVR